MNKTGTAWGDYLIGGVKGMMDGTEQIHEKELDVTAEDSLIALNNFITGYYTGNWSTPTETPHLTDKRGNKSTDLYDEQGNANTADMKELLSLSEKFVGNIKPKDYEW
tara:strand:- start:227 stop:550 length:324 start_codon:yes stop_codon:yes gene_type:complete